MYVKRRPFLSLLVIAIFALSGSIAPAYAQDTQELSPSGGIGNTRADFHEGWGPLQEFGESYVVYQQEYVNFDTPDYDVQLSAMFLLEPDLRPRETDRLIWLMLSLGDPVNKAQAERMIEGTLPRDAELERTQKNRFDETQEVYRSADALQLFPTLNIDEEEIQGTGEIWVTYGDMGLGGSNVVGIEICLYDDYGMS